MGVAEEGASMNDENKIRPDCRMNKSDGPFLIWVVTVETPVRFYANCN